MFTKPRRLVLILLLYFCGTILTNANGKYAKINPQLRLLLTSRTKPYSFMPAKRGINKISDSQKIPVLIKFSGTRSELNALGVQTDAQIGDIFSTRISPVVISRIINNSKVHFIQGEIYHQNTNDVSVPEIHAKAARTQYQLDGTGVLIGIVDTGIDWRHEDFRLPDGTTRIKYLLDFSEPGDANSDNIPDGPDAFGGTLYTEAEINRALRGVGQIESQDRVGHGTHVAGTAAGNGLGTGGGIPAGTYAGVATQADLIIVKATLNDDVGYHAVNLVNSIAFIDSIAHILGQPYVINLSLGGQEGAHDGTNLEEIAIDNLTGAGKPGKVIVAAAGNDGTSETHIRGELSSSQLSFPVTFKVPEYTPQNGATNDYVLFNVWYSGATTISVTLQSPANKTYGPVSSNGYFGRETNEGTIYIENALDGPNQLNGDKQIVLQIYDSNAEKIPSSGNWTITLRGNYSLFDLWMYGNSCEAELTTPTQLSHLISIPGTAREAITVGSYITKKNWTDYYGNDLYYSLTIHALSDFSSPGPTRDDRIKPEIVAPGQEIASTFSCDADPANPESAFAHSDQSKPKTFIMQDNKHGILRGTSMATPHVTGTVALLLEKNPLLDAAQIKDILINSAHEDAYTGSVPNYEAGYGKIDVLNALSKIEQTLKFPAPRQLRAAEVDSGIHLTWQVPTLSTRKIPGTKPDKPANPATPITRKTGHAFFPVPHFLWAKKNNEIITSSSQRPQAKPVGYNIFRSTEPLQDYELLAANIQTNEYLDSAVVIGQQYWYYITAIYENPSGESMPSNKVSAIRGSEQNIPLEISYDSGSPAAFGKNIRIIAQRFALNQSFSEYHLNQVRFLYYIYQAQNLSGKSQFRILMYTATSQGDLGYKLAQTDIITKNKIDFAPNWTEIDLRFLEIVKSKGESVIIGIEYVAGDSATVLFDNSSAIEKNRVFYYFRNRWEEHYDFWSNPNSMGYPMIRSIFTSRASTDSLPTPAESYEELANFPNPFGSKTTFTFQVSAAGKAMLDIFDIRGRFVKTLLNQNVELAPTPFRIIWDGTTEPGTIVPAGVYFARLKTSTGQYVRKLLILR